MTNDEKKQYLQDLAITVYAAYQNLLAVEEVAKKAGLRTENKQNMWFEGARDKIIPVLVNGVKK